MSSLRHYPRSTRIAGICVLSLGVGLALSGCAPGTSPTAAASTAPAPSASASAAGTAASPVTTSAPARATTPPAPAPSSVSSATLVPMQTAAGGEFLSPSGNISCEVDYHRASLTQVYCQTVTPARSVTMGVGGQHKT